MSDRKTSGLLKFLALLRPHAPFDRHLEMKVSIGRQMRITLKEVEMLADEIVRNKGASTPLQLRFLKIMKEKEYYKG